MSTESDASTVVPVDLDAAFDAGTFRPLALGSVLVLTASYVAVLREVTQVVGGSRSLLALVVFMLAAATLLAKTISPRTATGIAVGAAVVGFSYYLHVVGIDIGAAVTAADQLVSDTVALATGLPILRMVEVSVWTYGFVPAPVFLSWYLALRGRYVRSVAPGGLALLFLVLTGDASAGVTLLGTLGGIATVGFGELERREGTIQQADVLAVLFAVMIVLSLSVTLVPAGTAGPEFLVDRGGAGTLEGSLTDSPDRAAIAGSVELSPEVRFTVRSEEPAYWRVGVYDRFTGGEWIRTGQDVSYEDGLPSPPGDTERVTQTVFVEDRVDVMPTAAHPVAVEGDATENTRVTPHGQVRPDDPLIEGDVYNAESAVVNDSPEYLRDAGTDYPDEIEQRYLQTPESLSDDFEARTSEVVADADDPYDAAAAIEAHLKESKSYSLNVSRPDGNVAESFLREMDEGYCVYFATTMVQMLRAEDVPARYVSGYTTGQQVDDNEWVVRGLNAHAWVEVYFPDRGWVAFDPTPSDPRDDTRTERVEDAREAGEPDVDTDRSEDLEVDEAPADELPFETPDDPDDNDSPGNWSDDADPDTGPGPAPPPDDRNPDAGTDPGFDPDDTDGPATDDGGSDETTEENRTDDEGSSRTENALFGAALLLGLVAGAHRTGATTRASRTARMHWHGFRGDPDDDVERAYRRLEVLLDRRYRPRGHAESVRQYHAALAASYSLDPRVRRVGRLYERAKYGDGLDREEADEAVGLVDDLVRESTPILGRIRR